jgi:hypothetical protein
MLLVVSCQHFLEFNLLMKKSSFNALVHHSQSLAKKTIDALGVYWYEQHNEQNNFVESVYVNTDQKLILLNKKEVIVI